MTVYRVPMVRVLHLTVTVDAVDPEEAVKAAAALVRANSAIYPYYETVEYGAVEIGVGGEPEVAS